MARFVDDHRGVYGVEPIRAVLSIATSNYYRRHVQQVDATRRSVRAQRDDAGHGGCAQSAWGGVLRSDRARTHAVRVDLTTIWGDQDAVIAAVRDALATAGIDSGDVSRGGAAGGRRQWTTWAWQ